MGIGFGSLLVLNLFAKPKHTVAAAIEVKFA